jgi:putative GTP pyrophosphokinase
MKEELAQEIIGKFEKDEDLYEDFAIELQSIIEDILDEYKIHFHSVPSRVKSSESLINKINRSDKNYKSLEDVTDLIGLRIITYFSEDVDRIANIIENAFKIDQVNSIDKRVALDPDRFGYLSLHYVISFKEDRLKFTEYRKYKGLKAEIQIRSILQHTWAEIEHDLGYKSKAQIPKDLRRSFSRIAGLLEIADLEFVKLRSELVKFEEDIITKINNEPFTVIIDEASLTQYLSKEDLTKSLDRNIANNSNKDLIKDDAFIQSLLKQIQHFKIYNFGQLIEAMQPNFNLIVNFSKVIKMENANTLPVGVGLHYLCLILVVRSGNVGRVTNFLKGFQNNSFYNINNVEEQAKRAIHLYRTLISNQEMFGSIQTVPENN